MSSYTTTMWEYIKSLNNYKPAPIPELIEKHRKYFFDFDYETPKRVDKETFKKWFETTFITKFLMYEIGFDTMEMFKVQLYSYVQSRLPYYCVAMDNLLSITPSKAFTSGKWGTTNIHSEDEYNNKTVNDNTSDNMGSTLPINMLGSNNISNVRYADSSSKNESKGSTTSKNTGTRQHDEEYDIIYTFHIEKLMQYNKEYKKWYDNLFAEFDMLFLGVL